MKAPNLVFSVLLMTLTTVTLQAQNRYLHSKGGILFGRRMDVLVGCIREGVKFEHMDFATRVAVCKCSVDLMNRNFTDEQINRHKNDLNGLFGEDSSFLRRVHDCVTSDDGKMWSDFQQEYVLECKRTLQEATQRPLDTARINDFGHCQLEMALSNDIPYTDIKKLDDPDSDLFRKVVKKCGSPFKN